MYHQGICDPQHGTSTVTKQTVLVIVCALVSAAQADAALYSLVAVKKNGTAIPPTSSLSVAPGDRIEANIFLSGWGTDLPEGVRIAQARVVIPEPQGGARGLVLPCGFDVPSDLMACLGSPDCPAEHPNCIGICVKATSDATQCAFIDVTRADFLFPEQQITADVDFETLRYFMTKTESVGRPDLGAPAYVGTLILDVSPLACGMFVIGTSDDDTFVGGTASPPNIVLVPGHPLTLSVTSCVPLLLSCDPAHCDTDARIPHEPENPTIRLLWREMVMTFDRSARDMTPSDFEVVLVPNEGVLPGIASVTPVGNSATVMLNRRISPKQWTCLRHLDSGRQCCMGSLPADANRDRMSLSEDVEHLLDNLLGMVGPALRAEQCDIDRSSLCAPADLLMGADLLSGVETFLPYLGAGLPECPPEKP